MKRVWVVIVRSHGVTSLKATKVFDAPKYKVVRYARRVLKALGAKRTVATTNRTWIRGFRPGERIPSLVADLQLHTLRDTNDELLQEES